MKLRWLVGVMVLVTAAASTAAQERGRGGRGVEPPTPRLKLSSSAFRDGGDYPLEFSCYGNGGTREKPSNINPPLSWTNVPKGTESFVLAVNGTDNHPNKGIDMEMFWVVYNIPANVTSLPQGIKPGDLSNGAHQATGQRGLQGYRAPCAPAGVGRLHYVFNVFALDTMLNLPAGATETEIRKAMDGHIIGSSIIVGAFEKQP